MNVFWTNILMWVAQIFAGVLGNLTPTIKAELNAFLTDLYKRALATDNPWDDFAIGMVLDILAVPRPPPD